MQTNMNFNNIIVAGAARNCGKSIIPDIEHIQKAINDCKNIQYLIIESDSNDNILTRV